MILSVLFAIMMPRGLHESIKSPGAYFKDWQTGI